MATKYEVRYFKALEEAEIKLMQHYGFEGSLNDFFKHHDWFHDPVYWKLRYEATHEYCFVVIK